MLGGPEILGLGGPRLVGLVDLGVWGGTAGAIAGRGCSFHSWVLSLCLGAVGAQSGLRSCVLG